MAAAEGSIGDRGAVRRIWLAAGLAVWLVAGVYLVSWALSHGLTTNVTVSVYHLVGYAGLLALVAVVLGRLGRAVRQQRDWRAAFAGGLEGLPIALVLLIGYVVLDVIWSEVVAPLEGIENSLSPSRILLPAGLGVLALTPLRVAAMHGRRLGPLVAAAVVGAAVAAPALSIGLGGFHPIVNLYSARADDIRLDDSDIWTMAADGSRQTRSLPAGNGIEVSLAGWSPDGSRMAWTQWTIEEGRSDVGEVWVGDSDGDNATALTDGPATDWIPAWSPDGQWIVYTAEVEQPEGEPIPMGALPEPGRAPGAASAQDTPGSDLWLVHPDGTGGRALTTMAGGEYLASWSPDGTRIVFGNQNDFESGDLFIVEVATGSVTPLLERPGFDWAPNWSPDGSTITFESDVDGSFDIWSIGVDGANLRRLTGEAGGENHPRWSPDGSRIAYVSDQTGDGEIWSMAPDGSDPRNLTQNPWTEDGYWGLDWSRDGSTILYASSGMLPAHQDGFVRIDLAAAAMLLRAAILAILAVLLVRVGPPFGAVAVLLGVDTAFAAVLSDAWAFIPTAIAGGLIADLAVRQARRWRAVVAGAAVPAAALIAHWTTQLATGTAGWTFTLWAGVILAAALFGALIGWLASTAGGPSPDHEVPAPG